MFRYKSDKEHQKGPFKCHLPTLYTHIYKKPALLIKLIFISFFCKINHLSWNITFKTKSSMKLENYKPFNVMYS